SLRVHPRGGLTGRLWGARTSPLAVRARERRGVAAMSAVRNGDKPTILPAAGCLGRAGMIGRAMADVTHVGLLRAVVVGVGCAVGCVGERPDFGTLRGASDAASDNHTDDSSLHGTSSDTHNASDASPSLDSGAETTVSNETTDGSLVGSEADA